MKLKSILLACVGVFMLASCNTSKTVLPYFTDISQVKEGSVEAGDYMPTIKPDDELFITVTSREPLASAHYNLPLSNPATNEALEITSQPKQQTYVVNSNGDINFPVLGLLHVEGLTT